MFNRYWRSYPWFFQLVQFVILMFVLLSLFSLALTPFALYQMNVSLEQVQEVSALSPRNVINAALLIQFFSALCIFVLPPLLYAYFAHPRPAKYLGLVRPGKKIQWVLVVVIILSAIPFLSWLTEIMSQFDLGEAARKTQDADNRMIKAFTSMTSPLQLFFSFTVLAVLAGTGEELFFRGLLMRFAAKRSRNFYFPLILAALLFMMMHTNFYGWPAIFIAGLILGSFYMFTGSLWCSILGHISFNGFQVLMIYFARGTEAAKSLEQNSVPLSLVAVSTAFCIGAFYLLWKNRTPLQPNWSADFTDEELTEEKQ